MLKTLHNIKTKYYHKEPFIEICEDVRFINNKDLFIKLVRVTIRYMVRLFGYKIAIFLLSPFQRNIKKQGKFSYIFYLINLNRLRLINLLSLKEKGFFHSIGSKIRWAEFQVEHSLSARARWSAKIYLNLLYEYGLYTKDSFKINKNYKSSYSHKKFYIYGPNADDSPNEIYQDYSLILTKPLELDLIKFKEKFLYLNSIFYQKKVINDVEMQRDLLNQFIEIYISCRQSLIEDPFKKAPFPLGDNLCGPMALGRILHHLRVKEGKFDVVIEGFDLYLKSKTYRSYYPSLARTNLNEIDESLIVKSLSDHDALFNFLYIKNLLKDLNVKGSSDFLNILAMSPMQYLGELSKVRETSLI